MRDDEFMDKFTYQREANEEFDWKGYDERLPAFEDLVIAGFKCACLNNGNSVTKLSRNRIPAYYPRLLKDFYQKCAPVRVVIDDLVFFPYEDAFTLANKSEGKVLPIAFKGKILPDGQNIIYMDKNWNGVGYDPRVQLAVGNQQVRILGSNIFTFIASITYDQMEEIPYID